MQETEELRIIGIAKQCAKWSFIIGTVIFLLFCISRKEGFVLMGLCYLAVAFVVNSILLFVLLINLINYRDRFLVLLNTIGIVLLNIPIALFYCWLFSQL